MGADGFVVFYGLKFEIPNEEQLLESFEEETDERIVCAQKHGIDQWFGRLTDGAPHHFFVGRQLGDFGVEGEPYKALSADAFNKIANETYERLLAAGFEDEPELHFQLEAQY